MQLYVWSIAAFRLFSLSYIAFVPVGQFQRNFADLCMLKFLQGLWKLAVRRLWKQPRPRSKCLLCNWYSCYLMVTDLCLHLLQLHLEWAEHQKGGRLRNVMVKIAQSFSKICCLEQCVSLVTLGINHEQFCPLQWNYPGFTLLKLRTSTAFMNV